MSNIVFFRGKEFKVTEKGELNLNSLGIESISEIQGLDGLQDLKYLQ